MSDAPGPDGSIRLGKRSLTARLVLGVTSLVIVLVLVVSGGTYLALSSVLSGRLDEQLQTTAQGALTKLFNGDQVPGPPVPTAEPVWAVALRSDGSFFNFPRYTSLRRLKLSDDTEKLLASTTAGTATTVHTTDGYELRVTTREASISVNGAEPFDVTMVFGLSTGEERHTLRQVLLFELGIGSAAVALALMMTYAGVRFSLRGLRRVTTTAQDVAAELGPSGVALQRRVPVTEEGTEVAQLADSINTLLQATETQFAARVESEERMRQFLADASHELRTPLTSIRGYAELSRMRRAAGDREDGDNLGRIESEGMRMSRLVEDLLLLARGDAAGHLPERVRIDVGDLLQDAVSSTHAAFPERTIDIDAMVPMQVVGDPDQLLRAVRNLITNAAVHTRPGPPIRVRAFRDDSVGPGVVIQIVDGGPGLPPEEAAHVFERFWRADKARTRARGGSGLGLSIVAAIVSAHGGSVHFDSSVEAGSTVTVWLPSAG